MDEHKLAERFQLQGIQRRDNTFVERELNLNQIFHYTSCITTKRVTSWWSSHLRVTAPVDNTAPFEEMLQRWQSVGNTVSNQTRAN